MSDAFKYGKICGALKWLEQQEGINLVSDDAGHWACKAFSYHHLEEPNLQDNPRIPITIRTVVFDNEWCDTIMEAIEKCMGGSR